MREQLEQLPQRAKDTARETKSFFQRLKKRPPKKLDEITHNIHEEVFAQTNCLDCANCCKTTGPLFERKDIERIAKYLRLKPAQFEAQYLRIDEDNDWVLQQVPCAFLGKIILVPFMILGQKPVGNFRTPIAQKFIKLHSIH